MRRKFNQGNKETAREKRKGTGVMSWLMMCLMLSYGRKTVVLYTNSTLNKTFHKVVHSLNVEVTILAHRESGPVLFQGILGSRWWYQ
jgi:hypothetical protein